MWETIRGYLTFTRKERLGVLFLLLLISVLFLLPYFFRPAVGDRDPATYAKLKEGIRALELKNRDSASAQTGAGMSEFLSTENEAHDAKKKMTELFYFDPNTTSADGWQKLGLNVRLAHTIIRYVEKGGRFRNADDLQKIYGLHTSDYERLLPYVRLSSPPKRSNTGTAIKTSPAFHGNTIKKTDSLYRNLYAIPNSVPAFRYTQKSFNVTDINLADSTDWTALPGIGSKLAFRILRFREKLGGFYQVEQVGETFGLPDSVFQKIKSWLRVNMISLRMINLNKATPEELQSHPYIRWQMARGIIEYRNQHGNFQSVDELLQLAQMDAVKLEKLRPYLTVKP